MKTVGELLARADTRFFASDFADALYDYAVVVGLQPANLDARLRVADCLLALGEAQRAAVVYATLARHTAHAGYPLRALVAIKILAALEPKLGALLDGLAQLYGLGSPRLGRTARVSPADPRQALPDGIALESPWKLEALIGGAEKAASNLHTLGTAYPETLPPIPLFSELPAEAFATLLRGIRLVRVKPGDVVLLEGTEGRSFFVLARGTVRVTRTDARTGAITHLATLHEGAIFGEMALVSAAPRSATVSALTDADVIEFDRTLLDALSREAETVARALDGFRRERVLHNLLATAPLFSPLTRQQRLDLVRRFTSHAFRQGDVIIREGQRGKGLFLVLAGQVDISKVDGDEKVLLATLGPGEVFGEMSLVHEKPASATATGAEDGTVLFLGREYFERLVEAVPPIRTYVEGLSHDRLKDTRRLLDVVPALDDDEGVVEVVLDGPESA